MGKALFCLFPIVNNESHEKTKTCNSLVHLEILFDFTTVFVALSPEPIGSYWRQ